MWGKWGMRRKEDDGEEEDEGLWRKWGMRRKEEDWEEGGSGFVGEVADEEEGGRRGRGG